MRIQQSYNFCLLLADKFQWSMGIKTEINSTLLARFSAFKYKNTCRGQVLLVQGVIWAPIHRYTIKPQRGEVKRMIRRSMTNFCSKGPPTSRGPLIIKCCESRIDLMGGLFYFSQKQSARNLCIKVISVLFLWLLRHPG